MPSYIDSRLQFFFFAHFTFERIIEKCPTLQYNTLSSNFNVA